MQNLKALLERLILSRVDFVLIGGFAGVVHGSTLVTQDLDICAALTEENVTLLRQALTDLHPKHRMNPSFKASFLEQPRDLKGLENLYLETDLGILDILSKASPVGDFARIKSKSIKIQLYGYECQVIALDDLIQIKESMSRPKDKQAVTELRLIRQRRTTS